LVERRAFAADHRMRAAVQTKDKNMDESRGLKMAFSCHEE